MKPDRRFPLLKLAAAIVILRVTAAVVMNYRHYLPPDFNADFLRGRETTFFGTYQWAFWLHLFSGPLALVLGLLLVSSWFRLRWLKWHRLLGRVQVVNVLCLLAPSGLWMAFYPASGLLAGVSFAVLSVFTAGTIALGWRSALQRRLAAHRRWMLRNFTLLCSAVVLRLVGGAASVVEYGPDWFDPLASWACWVVPLITLEAVLWQERRKSAAHSVGDGKQLVSRDNAKTQRIAEWN